MLAAGVIVNLEPSIKQILNRIAYFYQITGEQVAIAIQA
jgi:hypothetical protein